MIKNKAMLILGFIKRTCGSLSNPIPQKLLYCSLVRSDLEYCPLVWLNNTLKQNKMLESVQNNFYDLFLLNLIFLRISIVLTMSF